MLKWRKYELLTGALTNPAQVPYVVFGGTMARCELCPTPSPQEVEVGIVDQLAGITGMLVLLFIDLCVLLNIAARKSLTLLHERQGHPVMWRFPGEAGWKAGA